MFCIVKLLRLYGILAFSDAIATVDRENSTLESWGNQMYRPVPCRADVLQLNTQVYKHQPSVCFHSSWVEHKDVGQHSLPTTER